MTSLLPWAGLLLACTAVLPVTAHEAAHEHGAAHLDIAIEAKRITLSFGSPLDNLLGFERAPRTEAERAKVKATIARLNDAAALFRFDTAAQCRAGPVTLVSAVLSLGETVKGAAGEHADLDATYVFDCVDVARANSVEHGLFAFAGLRRVDVQLATPAGQARRTLKRSDTRIALSANKGAR